MTSVSTLFLDFCFGPKKNSDPGFLFPPFRGVQNIISKTLITVLPLGYPAHEHWCGHGAVCSQMSVATVVVLQYYDVIQLPEYACAYLLSRTGA